MIRLLVALKPLAHEEEIVEALLFAPGPCLDVG
jgi:hypothetical protein